MQCAFVGVGGWSMGFHIQLLGNRPATACGEYYAPVGLGTCGESSRRVTTGLDGIVSGLARIKWRVRRN
jgi:hypothetical protein